ncbi:MAG: hypothetical protein A2145_06460 [candidate division Zixibacteria bacterium RBG_16_40_9]|nr:MAG: hypothetical protein A2145_06460 [candidate division Zixibacteria bacterium RBG_16_40_9]
MITKGDYKLKPYISPCGWYSIHLPENWVVEEDVSLISIYNPLKRVGTLQISVYSVPQDQEPDLVEELAKYLIYRVKIRSKSDLISKIKKEANCAFYEVFTEGHRYFSYWMFFKNYKLFFITYGCAADDFGQEIEIIDQILNSLEVP